MEQEEGRRLESRVTVRTAKAIDIALLRVEAKFEFGNSERKMSEDLRFCSDFVCQLAFPETSSEERFQGPLLGLGKREGAAKKWTGLGRIYN